MGSEYEKHEVASLKFPYFLYSCKFQVRWKGSREQIQGKFSTGKGLPITLLAVGALLEYNDLSFHIGHIERADR